MLKIVKLFVILLFLCGVQSAYAGVEVEVIWPKDSAETLKDIKPKIYEQAFLQAVLKEANNLLDQKLSKQRLEILGEFLLPRIDKFIYGYRELSWVEQEETLELKLDCEVNKSLLRQELKKYGLLFTANKKLAYDLTLKGVSPEEFLTLSRLQTLTGVEVKVDAPLKVTILKGQEKWFGELVVKEHKLEIQADDLENLWIKLWAGYFDLPEVMNELVESFTLVSSGWVTIDSLKEFDKDLGTWSRFVLKKNLLTVELSGPSIKASWKVWSLNKEELALELKKVLHPQNIVFNLEE